MGWYLLTVEIIEGRNFAFDSSPVTAIAVFANDTKSSLASRGSPGAPLWDSVLQWRVSSKKLRELSSLGTSHCKVSFGDLEGRRLGWIVLDMRTAKLNHTSKRCRTG
jgi:hypothetical protein